MARWQYHGVLQPRRARPASHSALRENNFSGETLKRFLTRIKQLNPSIELADEYVELLDGRLKPFDMVQKTPARKSVQEVEQMLRDKGEKWEGAGTLTKIADKL